MNNRICKVRFSGFTAICLISLCISFVGCKDEYKYDNEQPSFLGQSIYNEMVERGTYKTFIRLVDDLEYAEVLKKTGSKTLFVADDEAFTRFFNDNDWNVKSYEGLSLSQKKLLLNSAMINNAYLLEMMSSTQGPVKGECLRRETASDVTDSVPHFLPEELPISYNEEEKDYWARFRNPEKGGIYLALDASKPMMTHFLPAQMQNYRITDKDFEYIMGEKREKNDAFIYDCKVIEQDITCQNGYINRLNKVLVTPPNMAEMLRTYPQTKLFSHMIDRFSAPFYNETLTNRYNLLHTDAQVDSIYEKRYFSRHENFPLLNDKGTDPKGNPTGNAVKYGLNFDPGWNEYQADNKSSKEQDMGIIFVPTDEKLYEYFFSNNGGGKFLLEAYAPELMLKVTGPTDYENIYRAIDQIPTDVIQALLNNLMKLSFNESVPSKFETIKDNAQDPMLDSLHLQYLKEVKLANNGALFIMDEVLTPPDYAAVSAPAYVNQDMRIFRYAYQQEKLGGIESNFDKYLLAMSARFSFFVPKDGFWYIDPVSFSLEKGKQRALFFDYNSKTNKPTCTAYQYDYDFATGIGIIGNKLSNVAIQEAEWQNRLRDMLETHTIVHEDETDITGIDETKTGVECDKNYFLSKNGTPIFVNNATSRQNGCTVQGGFQLMVDSAATVIRFDDKTRETNGNGNGFAYELNAPIIPTIESVFSVLYNDSIRFGQFFDLCQTDAEVLKEVGITTTADQKRYMIFLNNKGLPAYDKTDGTQVATATNVKFFNNFRYTVYVPTNDLIIDAIENKGLPTWQQMRDILYLDDIENRPEWTEEEEAAIKEKVKTMATVLVNFLKNHFQDNAVFADRPAIKPTQYETQTLQLDDEGMPSVYSKLTVSSDGNGTLYVTDHNGNTSQVTDAKNIITRDYVIESNKINSSSSAIVHSINGILDYKQYANGRYDADFRSSAACKKYMRQYRLVE
ncbi:MAG: fasciclin domain-containing protein [Bacteroidaceae bacterium]|nr:fasciclin domain-containing protein [Bacteroidaceae bacterium]